MIQALIFDFDGLILDTEGPEYQAWQEIYQEHGCQLELATWAACIGTQESTFNVYEHLEGLYGQSINHEVIRSKCVKRSNELIASQPVLPGVEHYIISARRQGLKLAVASSSRHEWVRGHLTRLSLHSYFDCIKCADDVKRTKPDPELYLAALAELGVQAHQAIALEDSPNGILAAKRAGIFCVAIPNALTSQLPLEHADLRLTSLQTLPLEELLARLNNKY